VERKMEDVKVAAAILTVISIVLILLRMLSKPIFNLNFEVLLIHSATISSIITYIYLRRRLKRKKWQTN